MTTAIPLAERPLTESLSLSVYEANRRSLPVQDLEDVVIEPLEAPLGARVRGLDGNRPLSARLVRALQKAYEDHHILLYQGQHLSQPAFLAFATWFGAIFRSPADVPVLASRDHGGVPPDVVAVANIEGGYTGNGELTPHADHQWTPQPSASSFLYAREVPSLGGETTWTNLALAWETLPADLKARVRNLRLITYNPFVREGQKRPLYRTPNVAPLGPGFPHPLVVTHPRSGKQLLYISAKTEVELLDVDPVEGAEIVARLREHIIRPELSYRHSWRIGDIVHWDNLATLHARTPFDASERRVLWRISLAGGRPY
jgi:taurine dioxygenase